MARKLTKKQQATFEGLAKGESFAEAARKAGYAPSTASRGIKGIAQSPATIEQFRAYLASLCPGAELAQKLIEGCSAMKSRVKLVRRIARKGAKGENQEIQETEYEQEPDYSVRLRSQEAVARLLGFLQPPAVNVNQQMNIDARDPSYLEPEEVASRRRRADLMLRFIETHAQKHEMYGGPPVPAGVQKILNDETEEALPPDKSIQ